MNQHENLFDANAFAQLVKAQMTSRDVSIRVAASGMGISRSTLNRIVQGQQKPDVERYLRVQRWLGEGESNEHA